MPGKKIIGSGSTENKVIRLADHVAGLETGGGSIHFFETSLNQVERNNRGLPFENGNYGIIKNIMTLPKRNEIGGAVGPDLNIGDLFFDSVFSDGYQLSEHYDDFDINSEISSEIKVKALLSAEFHSLFRLNDYNEISDLSRLNGVKFQLWVGGRVALQVPVQLTYNAGFGGFRADAVGCGIISFSLTDLVHFGTKEFFNVEAVLSFNDTSLENSDLRDVGQRIEILSRHGWGGPKFDSNYLALTVVNTKVYTPEQEPSEPS
ncbi:hypothetical protein [Vibrio metschnikovii]|uniref:hypothetical protein n=1 Tax=Vibrio metschnikovii TaxID=28172 RepID=UPI001C311BE6|nr:hypothetical protein [Vibrio metschnikovii]